MRKIEADHDARPAGFNPAGKDAHGTRDTDAPLANQLERAEAGSPDLDSLSLSRRVHSLVGAASASRPPAARRGRSDHGMHTIDAARRDAPAANNRAYCSTPTAGVVPPSAKTAKAGTQGGTTTTAVQSNVQPAEFQPPSLFGGVAGGVCSFITVGPPPANPRAHVELTRGGGDE